MEGLARLVLNIMKKLNRQFWAGKRVLVTGHTGFKGAWLVLVLRHLGAEVLGLALPPEPQSLFVDARLDELVEGEFVDLRNREETKRVVDSLKPEIVIHFAAQALVRESFREPVVAFETNVMGAVHLFEALRDHEQVELVLTATTDKVYLNLEHGNLFREGDRIGGLEPYSGSKAAVEWVVSSYRESYFRPQNVGMFVCRAGNVIGGGDWASERLIPDAVRAARDGEPMLVRNPGHVRPWGHVLDVLAGYLHLVESMIGQEVEGNDPDDFAWNFGPAAHHKAMTVGAICEVVEELWTDFSWESQIGKEDIKESQYLLLDPARAHDSFSWYAEYSPEAAVRKTMEWYAAYLEKQDARALCVAQICEHPAFRE